MDSQKNQKIIRLLAIYTLAVILLPIFSYNFPQPIAFLKNTYIICFIWLLVTFLFQSSLLTSKFVTIFLLWSIIFFMGSLVFWKDVYLGHGVVMGWKYILDKVSSPLISILMYLHFIKSKDYKGLALVTLIAIIFILIASVMSIIGIAIFPGIVREMASGTGGASTYFLAGKIGIAGYGFYGSLIFILPIFLYYFKSSHLNSKYKFGIAGFLLLLLYTLLKSEFTTAFILALLSLTLAFFQNKKYKYSILYSSVVIILSLIIFNVFLSEIIYSLSDEIASSTVKMRIKDMGSLLTNFDLNPNTGSSYFVSSRVNLLFLSFVNFLKNPIIGGGVSGGHSTWIDILGLYGLLGIFPWVIIFKQQIKLNLSFFSEDFKRYYLLSIVTNILLGIFTTGPDGTEATISLFFIVPGMYFMKYLKKNLREELPFYNKHSVTN